MFIKGASGVGSHPKLHTYQEGYVLPVLTAEELTFGARHKGLLRQIRDLAEMPSDDYDRTYGDLIHHFMEFVQVLPHKTNGILGSLLNYSLARAVAVFFRYCQLRKNQTTPLIKFAVFSAALLKDVGRVISNQRIVMVDEEGEYIDDWNPFSGSLLRQSKFYKMYPIAAFYLRIESEVTPLLARQLLTRDAFLWLSSDLILFADWLSALLSQEEIGSKEITWILGIIKRDDILAILNSLEGAAVEMHEPAATKDAEAFYQWLKSEIENGKIDVNKEDASVHVVREGVLIEKNIFKQFLDKSKIPASIAQLMQQFIALMGIAKKSGADFVHARFMSHSEATSYTTFVGVGQKGRAAHEGMVVDADKVFLKKDIPDNSSLKSSKSMTASYHQSPTSASENVIDNKMDPMRF